MVKHVSGEENEADIFTKNTAASVFKRHIPKFVGLDKYMEERYPEPGAVRSLRIVLCSMFKSST